MCLPTHHGMVGSDCGLVGASVALSNFGHWRPNGAVTRSGRPRDRRWCHGFTLVELLVVIAVIGILVVLLLPAVQAAREAARRITCINHAKQIALSCQLHETAHGHFPSDGWGHKWVGDADRGAGAEQTGGWLYSLLPFLEEMPVYQMPSDGLPNQLTRGQLAGAAASVRLPLPGINCPTRRVAALYPLRNVSFVNADQTDQAARCDYVGNWGSTPPFRGDGPASLEQGMAGQGFTPDVDARHVRGVIFDRSAIRMGQIVDGSSSTYLLGENSLSRDWLAALPGHSPLGGGRVASAYRTPTPDPESAAQMDAYRFGSSHPTAWVVALCDGSVRRISFEIDLILHQRLADRDDGMPVEVP